MRKKSRNPRLRFLPLVILPALMPALFLPLLGRSHVPDAVLGVTMGVFIGLALVGFIWMYKGSPCSTEG